MKSSVYVTVNFILTLAAKSVTGLRCYDCVNVEVEKGSSSIFSDLIGKSNPNCGIDPRQSITCPSDANACASFNGYLRQKSVLYDEMRAKLQVRGCLYDDTDGIGTCRKSNSIGIIGRLLSIFTFSFIEVDGHLCTCKLDMCLLCDGGIELLGHCVKYWQFGLACAGLFVVITAVVACCCRCCGCCKRQAARGKYG